MADPFIQLVQAIRVGSKYQLIEPLGSGTFGKVYLDKIVEQITAGVGSRDTSNFSDIAIKLEHQSIVPSLLDEEAVAYEALSDQDGFPRVYWHGQQDDYQCLVMDLLGPNLEDLLQYCGGTFSLKTILMLANQLLQRFQSLHAAGYLYCDVKPENFLMGTAKNGNIVYMTDLGLATVLLPKFDQAPTNPALPQKLNLLGTCRYASIQGHIGSGLSKRDDLESLGYMLVYFMKGKLPWQGLHAESSNEKYQKVYEMKHATSAKDLCDGLPGAFATYFEYLSDLCSDDQPDYEYLRQQFADLFLQNGFINDQIFDWTILVYQQLQDNTPSPSNRTRRKSRGKTKKKRSKLSTTRV